MTRAADTAPGAVELKPLGETNCARCGKKLDIRHGETFVASTDGRVWHYGCAQTRTPTPSVATGEIVERLARGGAPASWLRYDELRRDGKPIPNDLCDLIAATLGTAKAAATLFEQQAATIAERDELLGSDDLVLAVARAMKPKLFDPHLTQESLDAPGMYIARDQVFWMARQAIEAVRTTLNRSNGS